MTNSETKLVEIELAILVSALWVFAGALALTVL